MNNLDVLKQALEVLEINLIFLKNVKPFKGQEDLAADCISMTEEMVTSLRQAIEKAKEQEPVAMQMDVIVGNLVREGINKHRARELAVHFITHTSPPTQCHHCSQRQWVGLTDEEIDQCFFASEKGQDGSEFRRAFARAIEAKLKEKNT